MIRFTLFYKTECDLEIDESKIREQAYLMAQDVQADLLARSREDIVPFEVREFEITDSTDDFFVECHIVNNDDRIVVPVDSTHNRITAIMSERAYSDQTVGCLVKFFKGNANTFVSGRRKR